MSDLEDIKRLKASYCYLVDTKRWRQWRALFTDDCRFEVFRDPAVDAAPDPFVARASESLQTVRSVHQVHAPVIELATEGLARGVWAMFDWLEFPPEHPFHAGAPHQLGYGYYEEEYRRDDGVWRISFMRLRRLRLDRIAADGFMPVAHLGPPPDPAAWLADFPTSKAAP